MSVAYVASPVLTTIAFATLDARQSAVAEALGFPLPWDAELP